jgi:hypothetical protein
MLRAECLSLLSTSSSLKMEAINSSEMSVKFYWTRRRHILQDSILQNGTNSQLLLPNNICFQMSLLSNPPPPKYYKINRSTVTKNFNFRGVWPLGVESSMSSHPLLSPRAHCTFKGWGGVRMRLLCLLFMWWRAWRSSSSSPLQFATTSSHKSEARDRRTPPRHFTQLSFPGKLGRGCSKAVAVYVFYLYLKRLGTIVRLRRWPAEGICTFSSWGYTQPDDKLKRAWKEGVVAYLRVIQAWRNWVENNENPQSGWKLTRPKIEPGTSRI